METKIEKINIKGISIQDLLNKKFVDEMKKEGLELDYVNLLTFVVSQENDKTKFSPMVFSHEKREEIKEKLLHLSVEEEKNLKITEKVLKKIIKK